MAAKLRDRWDGYWADTTERTWRVPWNVRPENAVGLHLPYFRHAMDRTLPLVDLGCGHGRQTAFLAERFPEVVGVDISEVALEHARANFAGSNVQYAQLDVTVPDAASEFHDRFGDVNVYMRGVLHLMSNDQLPVALTSLRTMLGARGVAFFIESFPSPMTWARPLLELPLVSRVDPVLRHKVMPNGAPQDEVRSLWEEAGGTVLDEGPLAVHKWQVGPVQVPGPGWFMLVAGS